jgi:AcrR family transcriptional regulator
VSAGRRERNKAANRTAMLAAGQTVFGERGYGAANVREIVRRTELASGTFYNYFSDKEAIFRALVEETGAEARRRVRAARAGARDLHELVEDAYRAYFEFIVENPERFAFLRRNTAAIRALFGDAELPAAVGELAADLRARDDVPPGLDIDYCAHSMVAVGLELGDRLMERDPPDVEGATRFATELFVGGLEHAGGLSR